MSKYALVSAKVIIAQVMRGVNYNLPASYIDDILEWTAEGLGMMQVTNTLITQSTGDQDSPGALNVTNHCVDLPCGFVSIAAVEDQYGNRLPEGADESDLTSDTKSRGVNNVPAYLNARVSSFEVNPYNHQTSTGLPTDEAGVNPPYYIDGEDIQPTNQQNDSGYRKHHYYKLVGNKIQTSFECGYIKLHYYAIPVDKEGFPMLPDNSNFRMGLEYHILRRLIASGYKHPIFSFKEVHELAELYIGRGMGEVSFYTPEGAAKLNRSFVRLIPNYAGWENFGVNNEAPERLRL